MGLGALRREVAVGRGDRRRLKERGSSGTGR